MSMNTPRVAFGATPLEGGQHQPSGKAGPAVFPAGPLHSPTVALGAEASPG